MKNHAPSIAEINLEIGDFSLVVESLFQHSFEIVRKGTIAENAVLKITRTPGVILCEKCHEQSEIWFDEAKNRPQHASDENSKEQSFVKNALDDYASQLTATDILRPNEGAGTIWGRNLFQCRHCGSHDTGFIKGRSIIIKSIRVAN
jgi:Zn finger protein HypA/HybF involved in hydrogenase expression